MFVWRTNELRIDGYKKHIEHIYVEQMSIERRNAYILSIEKNVNMPSKQAYCLTNDQMPI